MIVRIEFEDPRYSQLVDCDTFDYVDIDDRELNVNFMKDHKLISHQVFQESIIMYVMGETGKTIDTIQWKPTCDNLCISTDPDKQLYIDPKDPKKLHAGSKLFKIEPIK